jgi:hypothetical protein
MPKFNLYPHPSTPAWDEIGATARVEVGWSNAPMGAVQIATTKLAPGADRNREYIDGSGSETEPIKPAWDGQYIDLDRDQINELIRALRQARDKAYGRDE